MFTGIVEEKGILKEKIVTSDGFQFVIEANLVIQNLKAGDSIAVNGCALNVIRIERNLFTINADDEVLNKTNLGVLKQGMNVNLERHLVPDSRLGGHFVVGHIDTTGRIEDIKEFSNGYSVNIFYPEEFQKYLIYAGLIAVDGVSLRITDLQSNYFSIIIPPLIWKETVFTDKKNSDTVNLEFDVLGKYVERIIESKNQDETSIFLN